MTADFYPFDMDFLGRAATRIINEVKGINRVVYDVTSKPPGHDRVGVTSVLCDLSIGPPSRLGSFCQNYHSSTFSRIRRRLALRGGDMARRS